MHLVKNGDSRSCEIYRVAKPLEYARKTESVRVKMLVNNNTQNATWFNAREKWHNLILSKVR